MAKNSFGKERILAIERLIGKRPQTTPTLLRRLENEYGIKADRKTVYDDIAVLTFFIPIEYIPRKGYALMEMED